jgi:hypothetical protein
MKRLLSRAIVVLAATAAQSPGHPFDPSLITPGADSLVIETRADPKAPWRATGGLIQTVARDTNAIRISVDIEFANSAQRVEMAMHPESLAPLAHWETLNANGRAASPGQVIFRDGRAKGAFLLSKSVFDIPLDSGIVDDDASTVLLTALPLDSEKEFSFRTFASPGELQLTRVRVVGDSTFSVPAGNFTTRHLLVMSRDTSHVYVSTSKPRRVVLVRLGTGLQQMVLYNKR